METLFVLNQTLLLEMGESQKLIDDLQDVLVSLREMMRCDVMNEPFRREFIIGLSHAELREHSHNPMKFYKIKQYGTSGLHPGKGICAFKSVKSRCPGSGSGSRHGFP